MVSPVYTAGYGVLHIEAVAEDGESVAYYSPGSFEDEPNGLSGLDTLSYLAYRTPSKWQTTPIVPPATVMPAASARDVSATLGSTIALGSSSTNFYDAQSESTHEEFRLHETGTPDVSENWPVLGGVLEGVHKEKLQLSYMGASDDFCHLFFGPGPDQALLPAATGHMLDEVYELSAGCHGEPIALQLVSENDAGVFMSPQCEVGLGSYAFGNTEEISSEFNAIADEGSEVLFETCIDNNSTVHQLFARLGASRTIEVSKSIEQGLEACGEDEIPCPGAAARPNAHFAGASEDGTKVYFTTAARLVSGDTDSSKNLYVATIGCPSGGSGCSVTERRVTALARVSGDLGAGAQAEVQGVVRVAPDGQRAYFVARGVLSEGQNAQGEAPAAGADNLYVYDDVTGSVAFIADLCSGRLESGTVEDSHCPGSESDINVWSKGSSEAQTAGVEGRFLVFSSYGQLARGDTDTFKDVYRYDAATGSLERVSIGEEGYGANGNGNCDDEGKATACDATILVGTAVGASVLKQYEMNSRAISEDGQRIVFETEQELSPQAKNGLENVYEWHETPGGDGEGSVRLLSGGSGETPVDDAVISPSGRDVFLLSTQQLTSQYLDGTQALYDARLGGGFPEPEAAPEPCAGEACQGPLTNPAPLLVPGSVSQEPGQNLAPPPPPKPKKAVKKKSKKAKHAKGKKAGGKAKHKAASASRHKSGRGDRS